MLEHERKLLELAPAVWLLAELKKDIGWTDEQERIMAAAKQFRNLSDQEARDAEAVGRAIGVALGVLNPKELTPLDQGWTPEWLLQVRDERKEELDWQSLIGFVTRNTDFPE